MKHPNGYCDDCGTRVWGRADGTNFCPDCDVEDGMGPIRFGATSSTGDVDE